VVPEWVGDRQLLAQSNDPSIQIRMVAPGPGSYCTSVMCKVVAARLTCP
jgi:hypothetical protein